MCQARCEMYLIEQAVRAGVVRFRFAECRIVDER
jgi:hypothetical protein